MSRTRYVYKNVRSVPPAIKQAVYDAALRGEMTMTDIIGLALAITFKTPFEVSGEKTIGADMDGDQFRIRIPPLLQLRIMQRSRKTGETESSVVLSVLAAHFGLEHVPVKRGRKRAAAA